MIYKQVLLVGDNEEDVFALFDKEDLIETVLNFNQSPSVGVLIELDSDNAQMVAEEARARGLRAGIYGEQGKGISWLYKVMNLGGA